MVLVTFSYFNSLLIFLHQFLHCLRYKVNVSVFAFLASLHQLTHWEVLQSIEYPENSHIHQSDQPADVVCWKGLSSVLLKHLIST